MLLIQIYGVIPELVKAGKSKSITYDDYIEAIYSNGKFQELMFLVWSLQIILPQAWKFSYSQDCSMR